MKIGVIGAGTMGIGIAEVFAHQKNFEIILCSSSREAAKRGKEKLRKRLQKRIDLGKMNASEAGQLLDRILVCDKKECSDCEIIVESVKEDFEIKRKLFAEMQDICGENCIFVTNTSSLSVTKLAKNVRQPVIGMHFFNPAQAMKLIEVVPGEDTPESIVDYVMELSKRIGKIPIRVKDNSGFVVNRLLIPMINEAIELLADDIASVRDIDDAMKLGANFPMGPLELADYIGLDVCFAIMQSIFDQTKNEKYRPSKLLKEIVEDGKLGVKTGKGFYDYNI